MAKQIYIKRTLSGSLVPTNRRSEDDIKELPLNQILKATISRPRNIRHHAKYWALLSLVFENQTYFKSVDDLHTCIKVATGYSRTYQLKDGTQVHCPTSISFAKMGQEEFEKYYEDVERFIAEQVIPGINREELRREVEAFL